MTKEEKEIEIEKLYEKLKKYGCTCFRCKKSENILGHSPILSQEIDEYNNKYIESLTWCIINDFTSLSFYSEDKAERSKVRWGSNSIEGFLESDYVSLGVKRTLLFNLDLIKE